jgi:membrane protein DedA with SNARE-associated domain
MTVQQFIANYGYAAILLLMIAESACIPLPSEITMLFGGALAAGAVSGTRLDLGLVIVMGTLGNVVGSYLAWWIGRAGGPPALHRWGRYLRLRSADLDRAHQWFARYGAVSVLIGRLLPVVRTFISLPAGIAGMPPLQFGIYTLIGCLPWTAALAGVGYGIGGRWHSVANAFHGPTYILAAIVVIAVVAGAVILWRRRAVSGARVP